MATTPLIEAIVQIRKAQDGGYPEVSCTDDEVSRLQWHDDNPTNITNQQILDKHAELEAAYDAKQYQRDRAEKPNEYAEGGYPLIGDQLDMMYHDQVDGTTTWKDAVRSVKDRIPKP